MNNNKKIDNNNNSKDFKIFITTINCIAKKFN